MTALSIRWDAWIAERWGAWLLTGDPIWLAALGRDAHRGLHFYREGQ